VKTARSILDQGNDWLPRPKTRSDAFGIAVNRFGIESSGPKRADKIAAMDSGRSGIDEIGKSLGVHARRAPVTHEHRDRGAAA
jgi:hypothetical protein